MPVPNPEKDKKRPSSIKVKSTTVKGKRGATTTTTTVAKKFKGTQGKNLGPNYKPSAATTAKANADKKKRTPPTSSKVTTVRKSKGVANVANASTRKLSTKITTKPKVKKFTKQELVSITKKTSDPKTRGRLKAKIRKDFPTKPTDPKVVRKMDAKNKTKKVLSNISNVFRGGGKSKSGSRGGCLTD